MSHFNLRSPILALLLLSSFISPLPSDSYTFESGEFLDQYRDEMLVIPGAQSGVTSIELHVSFNSKHEVQVENMGPNVSTATFHAAPKVILGPFTKQLQGFGWWNTLRPFDGTVDYQGGSGASYGSTVGHTVLLTTITDPQTLQTFVGSQVSIPLQFVRNNSVVWSAGSNNQAQVDSVFGWHGIIRYNY